MVLELVSGLGHLQMFMLWNFTFQMFMFGSEGDVLSHIGLGQEFGAKYDVLGNPSHLS